jgi:hypothetical protein
MRARDFRELRPWLPAAALVVLTACHSGGVRVQSPGHVTAPPGVTTPDTRPPADATYDWHVLLVVPFGVTLKDIPLTLHEVLLFRDEARRTGAGDDAECYAPDGPAPRFIGSTPEEYLLCFKHDRLSRVQASVRLSDPQPAGVFAAACEDWLRHASPAPADAAAPRAGAPNARAQSAGAPSASAQSAGAPSASAASSGAPATGSCEGSDGAVRFNARFDEETTLSIVLDGLPET